MKLRSVVAPLIAGLGVTAALAACGGTDTTKSSADTTKPDSAATSAPTSAAAKPAGAALKVAKLDGFGPLVVNDKGRTVYRFDKDVQGSGKSACLRECATTWQPLLESKNFDIQQGIDQSLIGTIDRPEGRQLTLKGWPLYYFKNDLSLGQTAGYGVGGTWFAVAPDGSKAPRSGRTASPGTSGSNY